MTAVEWLIEQIINDHNNNALTGVEWKKIFEQAKEMEKQQKIEFGKKVADHWGMTEVPIKEIEKFLNETYGSKGSDESIKQFSLYEHKETITSADTKVSETFLDHVPEVKKMVEISDEEIEKAANGHFEGDLMWSERIAFKLAIKWYREQLKKKQ